MHGLRTRIAALGVAALALGLTGCFTPPGEAPPPEDQSPQAVECRTGVANALNELGPRATAASVACGQNTSLGEGGVYDARSNRVGIFYGWPNDPGTAWFTKITKHEEGHAWDFQRNTNAQRDRYVVIRGLASYDFEDFADVFAMVVGGYSTGTYASTPPVTPVQRTQLCDEAIVPCS